MLAVERHYLQTYGGGFTENFYDLKRERVLRIKGGEAPRASMGAPHLMRETLKLKRRDVWNNLAIMVGLPYLKRKLDESYDIHAPQATILGPSYNRDALPPDPTIWQRVMYYYKWFLRNIYPSINAAYYFSLLAFNLAYLFDHTRYSSPFLWLVGTRIRRLGHADHHAIALAAQAPVSSNPHPRGNRPGQTNSLFNPLTLASIIYPRLLSSLKILLPTSIFALKFLEWWHASDFARQLSRKAVEGLELPPPLVSGLPPKPSRTASSSADQTPNRVPTSDPESKITAKNTVSLSSSAPSPASNPSTTKPTRRQSPPISSTSHLPILTVPPPSPATSTLCPICMHPIQTPTSAQTGYVFCYPCIFKWVQGTHDRQLAFMDGEADGEAAGPGWGDDDFEPHANSTHPAEGDVAVEEKDAGRRGRAGRWESGKDRCAVTGRRVLGGTEGLRRVMV
ncbi:ubiquitin-protein ligase peroxin 12 [Pseudocyphellaria aurata]|nr:ubiquitin-protein ligase peroxin 12 [Pseudocyphellaria aurata]